MTIQDQLITAGAQIKPMEFRTIWTNGFDSVTDTWLAYRNEYVKRNPDGSVSNILNGKHYTKEEYDEEIFNQDISVNYMQMINLEITSSTAFREFMLHFDETKAVWGQSSRDMKYFNTALSEELCMYKGTLVAYKEFKDIYSKYESGATSFDALRECLPVAYQTKFRIFLPVKQFMIYIACFYEAFHNILPETWKCIYSAMYENTDLRPWLFKLNQYRNTEESRMFLGKDKVWNDDKHDFVCSNMNYKYLGNIGSVLYSQLIRMENSRTYGYYEFLKKLPQMNNANCKATFPCWTAMSNDRVNEIMKTRTSWFASNTFEKDPNAWNAFMKNVWIKKENGEVDIKDNWQFFKFLMKDDKGNIVVNQVALDRYLADDEGRFHKDYNRFWISPTILGNDGRIMIDRLNQLGYSIHIDLWCQMWKIGLFKFNSNDYHVKKWYNEWIDTEHSKNTDYRKWTEIWNEYLTTDISVKGLMSKYNLHNCNKAI